ncbi:MAG: glycerophosphodiester phosphodiesterase family protein [Roseicyclus sp.]|jgi:glycerophosphoryl diester phosphodiesterase|nr:glycerophosphodiester phosphodiesterase family protein [Roseicyclus sp.]
MTDTPVSLNAALARLRTHPLIVAHRGDWRSLPENSVAAMLSARDVGADMVEIDVQTIADGTLVVIHDDTLDRTTGASGAVADLSSEALAGLRLRAGSGGDGAPLTDHALPTLEAMLDTLRGKVLVNIDTKHARDLDAVAALVISMGMQDQVLLKMSVTRPGEFSDAPWYGKVPFMPLCMGLSKGALVGTILPIAQAARAPLVELDFHDLADVAALEAALRPLGTGIWVNTLDPVHSLDLNDSRAVQDPTKVWDVLLGAGVRAIQTDRAEALARHLARAPAAAPA